ncbi:MAG TPA: LysR family transcriptional regulator [Mycobacterium sp.]|nr:LysR family transcriptional regulator [Mycobacterium sp.]
MNAELWHLRCLIAVVDHGGFTGAASQLGVSQPAVSRGVAALERELEVRLLRRTSREVVPTAAGERTLARARRLINDVEDLVRDAQVGSGTLRIGHAWAAMGGHTVEFQRRWAERHPDVELHLVRTNSPTGGLAELACDIAVVRTARDAGPLDRRFDSLIVGLESRYCAVALDDPLARRRQLRLADLVGRVVAVDPRTGTTTPDLWPPGERPEVEEIHELDDWLDVIAAGRCVGVTAESTTTQYRRQGLVFRRLRDAPPVPVRLLWWRDDVHPATSDVIGLLTELYRSPARSR